MPGCELIDLPFFVVPLKALFIWLQWLNYGIIQFFYAKFAI